LLHLKIHQSPPYHM